MTGKTLRDVRAERETLGVYCDDPLCGHRAMLDTAVLIERLGEDHGAMHDDLVGLFFCTRCRAGGRSGKRISFRYHPDYHWIHEKHHNSAFRAPK